MAQGSTDISKTGMPARGCTRARATPGSRPPLRLREPGVGGAPPERHAVRVHCEGPGAQPRDCGCSGAARASRCGVAAHRQAQQRRRRVAGLPPGACGSAGRTGHGLVLRARTSATCSTCWWSTPARRRRAHSHSRRPCWCRRAARFCWRTSRACGRCCPVRGGACSACAL